MPLMQTEQTVRVFVHTRDHHNGEWANQEALFTRVPCVGEIVTLAADGPAYEIRLVVHCPHEPASPYLAEVYALRFKLEKAIEGVNPRSGEITESSYEL